MQINRLAVWLLAAFVAALLGVAQAVPQFRISKIGTQFVVYTITEPNVQQAVTEYPSAVFQSGDVVTVSAGGCVQTGGAGSTWKRYVDPSGKNTDHLYHGRIRIPGHRIDRIWNLLGQTLTVPAGSSPLTLQLGYEDDGYGDNNYNNHDNGTDNQCSGVGAAWVVVVVQHTGRTVAQTFTPIPATLGVNGLPILTTDFHNPAYDTSQPSWSSAVCGGKRWLVNNPPRFEWTSIYNPTSEFDDDAAGLSGLAVAPADNKDGKVTVNRSGLSEDDVWFTHPFGFDWETLIAPDPPFYNLLAPSNTGQSNSPNDEYTGTVARARTLGLNIPSGLLGTETDQGLLPAPYRAQDGDRVALLGRWITDCGHEDFHSEIHPPLLFARAQAISAGSGSDASVTLSHLIGRPYLVGQLFDGSKPLARHLTIETHKVIEDRSLSVEAHDTMHEPFSGIHLFSYVVRAPVLPPISLKPGLTPVLLCTFHFTTRTGVTVQVTREGSDAVRVYVAMNAATYKPAPLPVQRDAHISYAEIAAKDGDAASQISKFLKYNFLSKLLLGNVALASWTQQKGVTYDLYDPPIPASIHDGEINQSTVDKLGGQQFSVDNDQPFPIYGWLRLEWGFNFRSVPINPNLPLQPTQP